MNKNKTKSLAIIVASLVVFLWTFFALAENKNGNNIFLDSDQDGLTDQEEKTIGTDPYNPDTDSDGYQDGKEVSSGYNPLKAAPGDALMPARSSGGPTSANAPADDKSLADKPAGKPALPSSPDNNQTPSAESDIQAVSQADNKNDATQTASGSEGTLDTGVLSSSGLFGQTGLSQDVLTDLSSDPANPNLTNEMIGQFLQVTKDKSESSQDFLNNPTLSAEDFDTITQNALQTVDIEKELPEIREDEMKILPAIDDKGLDETEKKEKQKSEIEKYFASLAFVFASNAPFPVDQPENLNASIGTEQENLLAAMMSGDQGKIDDYARRARTGIEQIKKVEVPYILKDVHKSALQLSIYTLGLKDKLAIDPSDPMKNLAALSSLQAVAESTLKLQAQLKEIADEYGISEVKLP